MAQQTSMTHPLELYKYEGVCDFDYDHPPCAEFMDHEHHMCALDYDELQTTIKQCKRYGLKYDCFKQALAELEPIRAIYNNMHDEDVIPIQR